MKLFYLKRVLAYIFSMVFLFSLFNCSPEEIIDKGIDNEILEENISLEENEEELGEIGNGVNVVSDAEIVLTLVNDARKEVGLPEVVLNNVLNQAAFLHSEDMLENNYFAHEGLNGSNFSARAKDAGYTGSPRSENIARGQQNPEAVFNAWMDSDGHRANILNSAVTEMGLGRSTTGNYWTQIFGVGN